MGLYHYYLFVIINLSDPLDSASALQKKNPILEKNHYVVCERKHCSQNTEREINWIFDQPEPVFLDDELRGHFEAAHRVNIT